jgi:hypothetical protein
MKPALSLEEIEPAKFVPKAGLLKEVWGKCPGDESIEELLAALNGDSEKKRSTGEKERRQNSGTRNS